MKLSFRSLAGHVTSMDIDSGATLGALKRALAERESYGPSVTLSVILGDRKLLP